MNLDERDPWSDPVDVETFPSSEAPCWRWWLLKFLSTADQLKWNYQTCCQKLSECLRGAVFSAFLEAKLSDEVELEEPSVSDILSRTLQVIGVSQIERIEERFLLELRQKTEESLSDYARRVGALKTLALKNFSDEHWASNCLSGLKDECLRVVVKDHVQITLIVRELERQDCLEQQLDVLWAKIHRVRRRHAEPPAQEIRMPSDKTSSSVAQSSGIFQKFRLLSKEKPTRSVADVNRPNTAECINGEAQCKNIAHTNAGRVARSTTAWKASYWGCEDSDYDSGDPVGEQEVIAHWQHPQRDIWSECSGDEEWSDEENGELWSKLDSDDDNHCPYEPLTLEEALTQIEDGRKARLTVGRSEDRILRTSRCYVMSSPAVAEWVADDMEYLPIFEVESGEIKVAAACLEYWIQLYDQRSPVLEVRDFKAKSVAVHLRKEAVYIETKGMQVITEEANRAEMTLERCSTLALRPSAVEVGMGQTPYQSAYHVGKLVSELSFVKVPRVHQSRQSWEWMIKFDQGGPLGEIRTTARNQSQMKQQPWVLRDVKHALSRLKPEVLRVNGQDEPARVELQVANDTDISKRQQLPVSWWWWATWILMMARLLNLGSHTLLNKSSTPVAIFSSTSVVIGAMGTRSASFSYVKKARCRGTTTL